MLRGVPTTAVVLVVLFWALSTVATVATLYFDPEILRANINWLAVWQKRSLIGLYWLLASLAALFWYGDHTITVRNYRWQIAPASLFAAAGTVGCVIFSSFALTWASRGKLSVAQAINMYWSFELLYIYFHCLQIIAAANAFHYFLRLLQQERAHAALQLKLSEAEVSLLHAQLEPHFLFNTLNSIASLVHLNRPDAATQAIQELSRMLRHVLDVGRRQWVLVAEEVAFTQSYLALQQLRFGSSLKLIFDVEGIAPELPMPPMLLQPLFENALKHGALSEGRACTVEASLRSEGSKVLFEIRNDLPRRPTSSIEGLGLKNLQQRLQALCPSAFDVQLGNDRSVNQFRVQLWYVAPAGQPEPTAPHE